MSGIILHIRVNLKTLVKKLILTTLLLLLLIFVFQIYLILKNVMMAYLVNRQDIGTVVKLMVQWNIQIFLHSMRIKIIDIFTSFFFAKYLMDHLHRKKVTLKMILQNYLNLRLILWIIIFYFYLDIRILMKFLTSTSRLKYSFFTFMVCKISLYWIDNKSLYFINNLYILYRNKIGCLFSKSRFLAAQKYGKNISYRISVDLWQKKKNVNDRN